MSAEAARRWNQQSTRKRRGETSDAEAAFKKIRFSAQSRLPASETRRMITLYFHENDDLSVPTYRVSLICPLSKGRMSVAARGASCTHIQCFDLDKYLKLQVQNSRWACPIAGCSKQLRLAQLRVDQYFCGALEALRSRPEVTDLDLLPNGDYEAVEPRAVPTSEEVYDDGSPYVPAPVEPKCELLDASVTPNFEATAVNASEPAELSAVDLIVIDDEPSLTTSRRRQSKSGKRHGPSKKELLDALAKKEAESNRREEQLQSAYEEIQRLRDALAGKETEGSQPRQEFTADRARLRRPLEEAQRCACDEAPVKCIPCEIRSLEEQIDSVQRGSWDLLWEIAQIETIKSDIQSLEDSVDQIAFHGSHVDDAQKWDVMTNPFDEEHPLRRSFQSKLEEHRSKASWYRSIEKGNFPRKLISDDLMDVDIEGNIDYGRIMARLRAETRSLRLELLPLYRNQRLPAKKHEELALLHERLESSKQQEQQLREKLQEAKRLAPSGN